MKGDIYEYESKSCILEGKYIEEYIKETGVDVDKIYSPEEATKILNSKVIAVYRNQDIFEVITPMSGICICEILSDIKEEIEFRIDVTCGEVD